MSQLQQLQYTIDNGLEFSSIATGPAEVFLRVDEDDPQTVYYSTTSQSPDLMLARLTISGFISHLRPLRACLPLRLWPCIPRSAVKHGKTRRPGRATPVARGS